MSKTQSSEFLHNLLYIVPNACTALAVVVGLTGVKFCIEDEFKSALICILVAGILDGLDGPIARGLNVSSHFGAELDSLCDLTNFGVSAGLIIYFWKLRYFGNLGWAVCLIYIICMACRLARFNAGIDFNANKDILWSKSFFTGVPAPLGAMLLLTPICFEHVFDQYSFLNTPGFALIHTFVVAFMLVSTIPTFSSKMINRKKFFPEQLLWRIITPFLIMSLLVFIIWSVITDFWLFISCLYFVYLFSIVVSVYVFGTVQHYTENMENLQSLDKENFIMKVFLPELSQKAK